MSYEQWIIIAIGSCVGAGCALLGAFLVLRRVALLADAISHAVLPGIAIAFLLSGSRSTLPMLLGAGAFGLLTVFLVDLLKRSRRMHEDASIGVVFPALFSIGVILVTHWAGDIDLDLDCILYGEIALAPFDQLELGGRSIGPRALWVTGGILLLNIGLVVTLFKELKVTSFDPQLAASIGISPIIAHYVLMGGVSVTAVGSFEAVGAILVVAMLIVPPATAYLLTDSLSRMLVLSAVFGVASAVLGYGASYVLECSVAGAMASVAGLMFVLALLGSPSHGVLARLVRRRVLSRRFGEQLVLLHLGRADGDPISADSLNARFRWRAKTMQRLLARLGARGLVEKRGSRSWRLTSSGERVLKDRGVAALHHGDHPDMGISIAKPAPEQ